MMKLDSRFLLSFVAAVVVCASTAFAGDNLVTNGDFESAGYKGDYKENCGSDYLIGWTCNQAGICLPKGTYLDKAIQAYDNSAWAFLKSISYISQDIKLAFPGAYRLEFDFCGRKGYLAGANTVVTFGETTLTNIVNDGLSANGTKVDHVVCDFCVETAGTYTLKFAQTANADKSPAFDNISLTMTSKLAGIMVASSPANLGEVTPPFGLNAFDQGTQVSCSSSTEVPGESVRYQLVGWKLVDEEVEMSGGPTGIVYTVGGGIAALNWLWDTYYRVTASAGEGGTVLCSSEWARSADTVVVTATAADGYAFSGWTGEVPTGSEKSNPLSLSPMAATSVTAVFAPVVAKTVKPDGSGDYATLTEALADLKATLPQGSRGEIVLMPGQHAIRETARIDAPITVRSSTGKASDVVVYADRSSGDFPVFNLVDAGAILRAVTVSNGCATADNTGGGATVATGALVDGCTIVSCASGAVKGTGGIALNGGSACDTLVKSCSGYNASAWSYKQSFGARLLNGGRATRCTFTGGTGNAYSASAVCMLGGTMSSCVVSNNFYHMGGYYGYSSAIWAMSGDNRLERCLIVDNAYGGEGKWAGGVLIEAGTLAVDRSTVAFNHSAYYGGLYRTGGTLTVTDSIVWGNTSVFGDDIHTYDTTVDPLFVNAGRGDYRLAANSPLHGKGCFDQVGNEPTVEADAADEVFVSEGDDINAAIVKCRAGGTVHVAAGTYPLVRHGICVLKGVKVLADEGPEKTTLYRVGGKTENRIRQAYVGHADGVLGGFTFTNAFESVDSAANVALIRNGMMTNCIIRDCHITSANQQYDHLVGCNKGLVSGLRFISNYGGGDRLGGALSLLNGAIGEDCIVTNHTGGNAWASPSVAVMGGSKLRRSQIVCCKAGVSGPIGALLDAGSVLENCLVADNTNTWTTGGAVRIGGNGAVVRNCTIVRNRSSGAEAGGIAVQSKTGVEIVNTVLWKNGSTGSDNDKDANGDASATFRNCLFTTAGMVSAKPCTDCLSGDPGLVGFVPSADSPLRDRGDDTVVFTDDGELDVFGRIRRYRVIDIGAAEYLFAGDISCTYVVTGNDVPGGTLTLRATVDGATSEDSVLYRWSVDGGAWTEWSESPVYVTVAAAGPHSFALNVKDTNSGKTATTDMNGLVTKAASATLHLVDPTTDGHVACAPYATAETAATNILDLVGYSGVGTVITIHRGSHPVTDAVTFGARTVLRGETDDYNDVILYRPTKSPEYGILTLGGVGSVMTGVAISNAASSKLGVSLSLFQSYVTNCLFTTSSGNSVYNDGGVLSHCVIRDTMSDNFSAYRGTPDAIIEDCIVTNCRQDYYGSGCVLLDGGRMSRCQVVDNDLRRAGSFTTDIVGAGGAGVSAKNGAVIENSLFAHNRANCGGAINVTGPASILNCTIVSNFVNGATNYNGNSKVFYSCGSGGIFMNADRCALTLVNTIVRGNGTVRHSAEGFAGWTPDVAVQLGSVAAEACALAEGDVTGMTKSACVTAEPLFRAPERNDFRLSPNSSCVNAGVVYEGISAVDLAGQPRVKGRRPDIGCYECQTGGMHIIIR